MTLRSVLCATTALTAALAWVLPAAAQAPSKLPSGPVFTFAATSPTTGTLYLVVPGTKIPVGTLDVGSMSFLPAGLGAAATMGVGFGAGQVAPGSGVIQSAAPVFGGPVANVGGGIAGVNSAKVAALISALKGTGRSSFGWNYLNGPGELDLFTDRGPGSSGGLAVFDVSSGTPSPLLTVLNGKMVTDVSNSTVALPGWLGTMTPSVSALMGAAYPLVPNLAALKAYTGPATAVMRAGFLVPGDGGDAPYTHQTAACTTPDNGAQVMASDGGCWIIRDAMEYSIRVWGAKSGNYDDGPVWRAALAFLGTFGPYGGPRVLRVDVPYSSIHGPQLVVPPLITVKGVTSTPAADQVGVPQINFYDNQSGIYMSGTSAAEGLYFADASPYGAGTGGIDTLIELGGGVRFQYMKFSYTNNGIGITHKITPALSSVVPSGAAGVFIANSTLVDGTYTNVPFSGGGGTGALLQLTVQNGQINYDGSDPVNGPRVTTGGVGYAPFFDFSLPANALYQGSPAVPAAGQIATANCSRIWMDHVLGVPYGDHTKNGIEIDATYDYTMMSDVQMWSPERIHGTTSVAYKFGHIDGGDFHNLGAFGFNYALVWSDPSVVPESFAGLTGFSSDLVGTGVKITSPLINVTFNGGIIRTLGKSFDVTSPSIQLHIQNMILGGGLDAAVALNDFDTVELTNNTFLSSHVSADYMTVHVGLGGQTMQGLGNYYIGGNNFDGSHPGIIVEAGAKAGMIGPNRWFGAKYPPIYNNKPSPGYVTDYSNLAQIAEPSGRIATGNAGMNFGHRAMGTPSANGGGYAAITPGAAAGEVSNIGLFATFGAGTDLNPRRAVDIYGGFATGQAWGGEYIGFGVGYGNAGGNDGQNPTTERMRLTATGLGIGTTTPAYPLDVAGAARVQGLAYLPLPLLGGTNVGGAANAASFNALAAALANSGRVAAAWNYLNGPGEADFIANQAGGSTGGFLFGQVDNSGNLTKLARLTPIGLGIGTDNPAYPVDVAGTARFASVISTGPVAVSGAAHVTAAGTCSSGATLLSADVSWVDNVPAGAAVILPAPVGGVVRKSIYARGTNPLQACPPTGYQIEGLAVNVPVTLQPKSASYIGDHATLECFSSSLQCGLSP